MYNRILMSMIAFGLAAFLMGGATMAWFTDATSTQITFQSGEVKIGVTDPSGPSPTWSANYDNMAPGQTVASTMKVKNVGTLPMKYRFWADVTGGDPGLAGTLQIKVKDAANNTIAGPMPLNTFVEAVAVTRRDGPGNALPAGSSENLLFEVTLPESANNSVAKKSVSVTFHFTATQPENTGWTE